MPNFNLLRRPIPSKLCFRPKRSTSYKETFVTIFFIDGLNSTKKEGISSTGKYLMIWWKFFLYHGKILSSQLPALPHSLTCKHRGNCHNETSTNDEDRADPCVQLYHICLPQADTHHVDVQGKLGIVIIKIMHKIFDHQPQVRVNLWWRILGR